MFDKQKFDILLVEDNAGDILLTKEAFKRSNFDVFLNTVIDGELAIEYLSKDGEFKEVSRPDLILLDLNLPKKDGREVLKFIKTDQSLKSIPVIILSTSTSSVDINKAYELSANSFVTKPVDFNSFLTVVKTIEKFWFRIAKLPTTSSI